MYKQQQKKRNTQKKFWRRKISLISKVDDLHRLFEADVFLLIWKKNRYYMYILTEELHWSLSKKQMMRLFSVV